MPRPRRNRGLESRILSQNKDPNTLEIPHPSAGLPQTAEGCAREMEELGKDQRMIMQRMKLLTAQLQQVLRKETRLPTIEDEAGEKTNNTVTREQASVVSDSEDEPARFSLMRTAKPEYYSTEGTDGGDQTNEVSTPLISALKKLQQRRDQKRGIKMWARNLASLFFLTDQDHSGKIDSREYQQMIDGLDISEGLKLLLRDKFTSIDKDRTNGINLTEFLFFFLKHPMFKRELLNHARNNAPYIYEKTLSRAQHWRQYLYYIVECPDYNVLSKTLFCIDLALTIVPIVVLCVEGVQSSLNVNWFEHTFMWFISIYFAAQYLIGLATCKYKKEFIFNVVHVFELVSFLFWIYFHTIGKSETVDPMGFVVFRIIRYINLHKVFKLVALEEDIDIYVNTLKLAYTSAGAVLMLLVFAIFFFSLLMYVFERGQYNEIDKRWERDEDEESPFAEMSSCIYFTLVTMTTLGYGDMSPTTYVGRITAVMTVFVGLCNITFLINIVGDCFEEVFREFVVKRSKKFEEEQFQYLKECVHSVTAMHGSWWNLPKQNKKLRHMKVLAQANSRELCVSKSKI